MQKFHKEIHSAQRKLPDRPAEKVLNQEAKRQQEIRSWPEPKLRDEFVDMWGKFCSLMQGNQDGGVRWAAVPHQDVVLPLKLAMDDMAVMYGTMTSESKKSIMAACDWPYIPVPLGKVSFIEWMLFLVSAFSAGERRATQPVPNTQGTDAGSVVEAHYRPV